MHAISRRALSGFGLQAGETEESFTGLFYVVLDIVPPTLPCTVYTAVN